MSFYYWKKKRISKNIYLKSERIHKKILNLKKKMCLDEIIFCIKWKCIIMTRLIFTCQLSIAYVMGWI